MLYVASLHNHAIVASGMYHNVFIKTENIVVDEIGRIMFASTSTCSYIFYRTLFCMHDTASITL